MRMLPSPFTLIRSTSIIAGCLAIVSANSLMPLAALAQATSNSIVFPSGPSRINSDSTIGAGRRLLEDLPTEGLRGISGSTSSECMAENTAELMALLPTAIGYSSGTTSANNPDLFFYIPASNAQRAEFILLNEQQEEVYWTAFNLKRESGIYKLSLPETVELEVSRIYQWEFALRCHPVRHSEDRYVQGQIQRFALSPEQQQQLEQISDDLVAQAQFYAEARIWHEALTLLAELSLQHPDLWQEFLTSAGLDALVQKPFLNCCQVQPLRSHTWR